MEMNYCRRCGTALTNVKAHIYKCEKGHTIYANSSPAVGIFFVSSDNRKVLLATRGREPGKGMLDAVGGFVDGNESYEEAATRELREEMGLEPEDFEPLRYITSGVDTYDYAGESIPYLGTLFWSRLRTDKPLEAHDDVASVEWYDIENADLSKIYGKDIKLVFFEHHKNKLGNENGDLL